jgi:hypothetical protein
MSPLLLFVSLICRFLSWYNVPQASKPEDTTDEDQMEEGEDSHPVDFDNFVPTHDPSLAGDYDENLDNSGWALDPSQMLQADNTSIPPADDAFQAAVQSSYWLGYWTAMYHVCSMSSPSLS